MMQLTPKVLRLLATETAYTSGNIQTQLTLNVNLKNPQLTIRITVRVTYNRCTLHLR